MREYLDGYRGELGQCWLMLARSYSQRIAARAAGSSGQDSLPGDRAGADAIGDVEVQHDRGHEQQ
jgi:hypothetical protein